KTEARPVYQALREAVLPELRPEEIFLYPQPLGRGNLRQPRSVGKLLAQWAAKANQVDDLRKCIEGRQGQSMAEIPAHVLLGLLGLEGKDAALAQTNLNWLLQRLQKDNLQNTAELSCHVALPALFRAESTEQAVPLLEASAKGLANNDNSGGIRVTLAR